MSTSTTTRSSSSSILSTTATIATVVIVVRYLQKRARVRAQKSVERVKTSLPQNKPLIDIENPEVRVRVVSGAIRRASKWMTLSRENAPLQPLRGQVGGASVHKKPLLTLEPDYVLKPLLADHRGVREIAFYEAMAMVGTKPDGGKSYRNFVKGTTTTTTTTNSASTTTAGSSSSSTSTISSYYQHHHGSNSSSSNNPHGSTLWQRIGDWMDTLAVFGAFFLHDPVVMALEEDLDAASKAVKTQLRKESELLRKLSNLTPSYYGVWGQEDYDPTEPYGVADDAHLLLQNITINYSCPCVMDLKIGVQTYEPDAPPSKRERERSKYKGQADIGFRIVGMRVYDPHHPEADGAGFRFWNKQYGRSLETVDDVKEALRLFFTIPTATATALTEQEQAQALREEQQQLQMNTAQEEEITPKATRKNGSSNDDNKKNNNDEDAAGAVSTDENHKDTKAQGKEEKNAEKEEGQEDPPAPVETPPPPSTTTPSEPILRTRAISSLLLQVRSVRRWFEENDCFQFYASSILIVYEGDRTASDVTALKMIDFGRVRRHAGGDKGYQKGLRTLKHLLADLLDEEEERLGQVRPR